jgi:CheY-like chemotaxis protein
METARAPILLVNDDPATSEGLRLLLERENYAVETAADGWEALCKLYEGLRPCLILLDLMMPVMDGYEFREQQLKMADLADIPIVVMSAVFDVHSAAMSHLRAKAYVRMPLEVDQVVAVVRRYCSPN